MSCKDDFTPKPNGFLSLDYAEAKYEQLHTDCPYDFKINSKARLQKPKRNQKCALNLSYGDLKGTIYLSYVPVADNLEVLLKDAQNLTQEHTVKADGIKPVVYENKSQNAYGILYEVEGDAASPLQFYITDGVKHFLRGSAYFYTKPNYDSILPAAHYLKKDIQKLMETIKWKEKYVKKLTI